MHTRVFYNLVEFCSVVWSWDDVLARVWCNKPGRFDQMEAPNLLVFMRFRVHTRAFYNLVKFGPGAIFWPSSGHDISGNAVVGLFPFPERNSDWRKDFCMTRKMTKNIKNQTFQKVIRIERGALQDSFKVFGSVQSPFE